MPRKNKKVKNKKEKLYSEWLKVISWEENLPWGPCPSCKASTVSFVLYGDLDSRMGAGEIWCPECLKGIHLCRARIPEHLHMYSFEEKLPSIIPEITYIQ